MNELECRLLAPRLAFEKVMQAPREREFKIHVVNVPAEVSDTVSMLPRLPTETGTTKVNLKRRLRYKSSALSLNIRLHKVVQAANWLISNTSLYRQERITLNQNWGVECSANCSLDDSNIENQSEQSQDIDNTSSNIETNTNCNEVLETEDQWSEDEVEILAGVTDTMLTSTDFVEDSESQCILSVAQGEGNLYAYSENENSTNKKKNEKRSRARIITSVWFNKERDPEKHYRELIMLFTPWRNEETDLIANCSSYQVRFFILKDIINEQVTQYAICSDDLNKIHELN